jgi:hypothetical protein
MATQHPRQPFVDQRWQLLENRGSEDIPPFSIVELVGAYQTEEGYTVMTCRKVTTNSPAKTAITGPLTMKAGGTPQPGTLDFPTYVRYTGSTPTNLSDVGPSDDTFTVSTDGTGYLVIGDQTEFNGISLVYVDEEHASGSLATPMVVTSTITAREDETSPTKRTAGKGKAARLTMEADDSSSDYRCFEESESEEDIYNWSKIEFPVDRIIWAARDRQGVLFVVSADCD